jgi:hypothetical protein
LSELSGRAPNAARTFAVVFDHFKIMRVQRNDNQPIVGAVGLSCGLQRQQKAGQN